MGRLDEGDQQGDSQGSEPGDLAEPCVGRMLAALRQQFLSCLPTQGWQVVQLLVQSLRSTPYPRFGQLFPPGAVVPRGVYFLPAHGMAQLRYSPLMRFMTRVRSFVRVR